LLGRNAQQREYIAMQQGQLAALSNPRSWAQDDAPQPQRKARSLISDEERKAYGDELLSVIERKSTEVVRPAVQRLAQENEQLREQLHRVQNNDVWGSLATAVPNWQEVNQNPGFHEWLRLPDPYSGVVRQQMLNAAFDAGDAGRVLAFFRGFLAENPEHMGQQAQPEPSVPPSQTPVRKAAVKLESLAAPGRASPSPPQAATSAQPAITNKDVSRFYWEITHGLWNGRDAEKAAREAQIHAAVRDGRVQIVK
jgi:hypothetical protein